MIYFWSLFSGNESPSFLANSQFSGIQPELTNELSAPYEVPQFPIEQIEKKLAIQRQLNVK
jgi:AMP deaminase